MSDEAATGAIEALLQQVTSLEPEIQDFNPRICFSQAQSSVELAEIHSDGVQEPKSEGEVTEVVKTLQGQIERFLNRRNDEFIEHAFNKHADKEKKLIWLNKSDEALLEFGVHLPSEEIKMLVTTMDIDNNGGLDLTEFKTTLRQASTPVEQFVETLPISGMLASSLAIPGSAEPLKELCNLDSNRLKAAIDAFSLSLQQVLNEQLAHLKTLLDAKEAKAQEDADGSGSKCAVFVMNAGSVKAYHEGMYSRIGEHTHSTHTHSNY